MVPEPGSETYEVIQGSGLLEDASRELQEMLEGSDNLEVMRAASNLEESFEPLEFCGQGSRRVVFYLDHRSIDEDLVVKFPRGEKRSYFNRSEAATWKEIDSSEYMDQELFAEVLACERDGAYLVQEEVDSRKAYTQYFESGTLKSEWSPLNWLLSKIAYFQARRNIPDSRLEFYDFDSSAVGFEKGISQSIKIFDYHWFEPVNAGGEI